MMKATDVLNEFLVKQGYDDEITALYAPDEQSYYDSINHIAVLGGMTNTYSDEIFMNYCKSLGLTTPVHIETISFLHEVGHHWTIDLLDEEEEADSEWTKFLLELVKEDDYTEDDYMAYFTCPIEYEATMDAINFCEKCPTAALELDAKLQNALYGEI